MVTASTTSSGKQFQIIDDPVTKSMLTNILSAEWLIFCFANFACSITNQWHDTAIIKQIIC